MREQHRDGLSPCGRFDWGLLSGLVVAGRVRPYMAADLGSMKVTDQINALRAMAVDPVDILTVPKVVTSALAVLLLTVICDFIGVFGSYLVGVPVLRVGPSVLIGKMVSYVGTPDMFGDLLKAFFFGVILSVVGCYRGFYTSGDAKGVRGFTTRAVVVANVSVLVTDYFLDRVHVWRLV